MAVNTASEKFTLSEYAKGLTEEPRKRYEEKLRLISCLDPFLLPNMGSTSVATPANHSIYLLWKPATLWLTLCCRLVSSQLSSSKLINPLMLTIS